jgi:hypothetical protein
MLKARRATIQIPVKARRIRSRNLLGDVPDDLRGHIGRLRQKRAEKPDGPQLQREPDPVAITTTLGDKTPVEVVKEEEPLQLRPRRSDYETAIRRLSPAARLGDHDREP